MVIIKTEEEVDKIKASGDIAYQTLNYLEDKIKIGLTTKEIDTLAYDFIKSKNAIPSFLGYDGFPGSVCISVNEEVVHGIGDNTILEDGDIVTVDVGVFKDGFHSDTARTYKVGNISKEVENLMIKTREALYEGIQVIKPGIKLNEICKKIESVAKAENFGIIKELAGHGVGHEIHEDPYILNYSNNESELILKEGMTLAIEPMFTLKGRDIGILENNWTIVTQDGSVSAHYEHTVAVTKNGYKILTGE